MSFAQKPPRLFNRDNVESIRPGVTGVYGIYRPGQWIYVGKGDIRQRLLAHLNGDNPAILAANPVYWVGEVRSDPGMTEREKELIFQLQPACNQRVG